MCYAGLTKGTFALHYALLITAARLGMLEDLLAEFENSQPVVLDAMLKTLPRLPAKAWRWEGEMHQIADTLATACMPAEFHRAAADVYHAISKTSLGHETPETIDKDRTLRATIQALSKECGP